MRSPILNSGSNGQFLLLLLASLFLLFGVLGAHEIWTQEHRWADIVSGMFYRHDFLHPYLGQMTYYDKPLLSYWLIAGIAWLDGELTTWALRAPSALAGILAIGSIYRLGTRLKDQRLGLLAGWMMLTTFYFIFWARTSSADMLNLAGSLFAVSWYFDKRDHATFFDFVIFFLILAVASLCKGLSAAVIAVIAIFPDLMVEHRWKKFLRVSVFLSIIPAALIYLSPFWASVHFGGDTYGQSGLYLVYRENFLRYFQPFDHKGSIYTYFICLPIYLLPWAVFFIPALFSIKNRWRAMTWQSKWMVWALLLLFMFFTLSGSRRNYYVLPMVPFAILLTADWILEASKRILWAKRCGFIFFFVFLGYFLIVQPLYYAGGGAKEFSGRLKQQASQVMPWQQWQYVMLDPELKVSFYLQLPPSVKYLDVNGSRDHQTMASLLTAWPLLKEHPKNMIIISRKQYEPMLTKILGSRYQLVSAEPSLGDRLFRIANSNNLPIAYIPHVN